MIKASIVNTLSISFYFSKVFEQTLEWAIQLSSNDRQCYLMMRNIYATGNISGETVDFVPALNISYILTTNSYWSIFIAKFSQNLITGFLEGIKINSKVSPNPTKGGIKVSSHTKIILQ